jgi:arsenate reductase
MVRVYAYEKCSTCRNALKFLAAHGVKAEVIPIRERPPTKTELKQMLGLMGGELRRLFNTSGLDYKALGMKDRLPGMSESEAIDLLSQNGNLVKRRFRRGSLEETDLRLVRRRCRVTAGVSRTAR